MKPDMNKMINTVEDLLNFYIHIVCTGNPEEVEVARKKLHSTCEAMLFQSYDDGKEAFYYAKAGVVPKETWAQHRKVLCD